MNNHLLFFFGTDCPHCDAMQPLIAKLTYETGLTLQAYDIWKNESAYRMLENYRVDAIAHDPECDGIPFFYNTRTKKYLCGEVDYKTLNAWAVLE